MLCCGVSLGVDSPAQPMAVIWYHRSFIKEGKINNAVIENPHGIIWRSLYPCSKV